MRKGEEHFENKEVDSPADLFLYRLVINGTGLVGCFFFIFHLQCTSLLFSAFLFFRYRDCPSSRSWFSEPHPVTGRAHLKGYKCSNGGSCNEATGQCMCQSVLFDGAACHTMPCPYNNSEECGGRGKCWTLNKLAR